MGICNDASKLPPEFARAERFDGVFFVDLPGRDQKNGIWGIYRNYYGLDKTQARPDDTNWTGARDQVVLPAGVAARYAFDSGRTERRARGSDCARQG